MVRRMFIVVNKKRFYGRDEDKANPSRLTKPDSILPARLSREKQSESSLIVYRSQRFCLFVDIITDSSYD